MAAVAAVVMLAWPGFVRAEQVGLIKIDGAIGAATATYISRAIDESAAAHYQCLIIEMDTPGGGCWIPRG